MIADPCACCGAREVDAGCEGECAQCWETAGEINKFWSVRYDEAVALIRWARAGESWERNLHGSNWRDRVDGLLAEFDATPIAFRTQKTQKGGQGVDEWQLARRRLAPR